MEICKIGALVVAFCFVALVATAQEATRTEESVEGIYLETNEDLIISQMAAVPDYETKILTLQYIQTAMSEGRSSPAIEATLRDLAGEGVFTQSRTAGRLDNNYTEVRRQASLLLADIPTEESKEMLVDLIRAENEPMVLAAAIYSLGEIGINENDEVLDQISRVYRRVDILNPTDSLAYSVLDAFEKLIPTMQNGDELIEVIAGIAVNGNYVLPVRQKAQKLLESIKDNS